ncbi:cobalamin-5'-phosphate synthase [Sediminitomix flava]|uniref:Adenosylcobinamide-GDP ribazoletransferase n=2 Tax=Sediminitomix flava TaxID=379075 RepID=A0A315Z8I7_SEDFL|nr:cobalamin-5'-phosphate synthase [Sediminitomix flava]
MFYSRIPIPKWTKYEYKEEYLNKATRYFPIIGWFVGFVAWAVFVITAQYTSETVGVVLSMISSILMTGAFHEDGFADFCDGFGGGWTKERILEIMKDSRTGAYGVVGIMLLLLLKFSLLSSIAEIADINLLLLFFVGGHALSRCFAASFVYTLPYVREDALSKAKPISKQLKRKDLWIAVFFTLIPFALIARIELIALFIPFIIFKLWMRSYLNKWIGGYTGDCLGAIQQVAEIVTYFGFLALLKA